MAHHRVGQKKKGEDYLKRLRDTMKATDRWTKDEEAQGYLREAEELVGGPRRASK
jgi:hypothetical protein